jgi:uncharacterized membrane protein YgdD (TMEM256/DUF423 family)
VHLVFDIFQGIGISAALGIRPFLPSLAVGALAAADVEIHFTSTNYHFLQAVPFLSVMVAAAALLAILESRGRLEGRFRTPVLAAFCMLLGACFFAGSMARGGYSPAPGFLGGLICAGVGVAASRPFLARLRSRLDTQSAGVGVPVIAEGSALFVAVLSVLAPPVGLVALLALLWLLWSGRGREETKYAGLRILR